MKILYTGTLYLSAGGPAYSTYHTMQGLNALGEKTAVLMYDRGPSERLIGSDVDIIYAPHAIEPTFAYSPSYKRLVRNCPNVDIYHAQGVWQYPTYALANVARSLHKPYLITPRGMLYPQDIAKSNTFFKNSPSAYASSTTLTMPLASTSRATTRCATAATSVSQHPSA